MSIVYSTPPERIGHNDWRCVVYVHAAYGPCTQWQWMRRPVTAYSEWRIDHDWPTYDGNDFYGGMPKSLIRVFEKYRRQIRAALDGRTPPPLPAPQPSLFT